MQTSSVCLRRQLPRRGKPGKGELRRALLQRGKPRKERKTAEALERAKRGKGWCGGWGRPLQSACADSFPEGEAGKGGIAQSASTERKTEKGRKTAEALERAKRGKGWCGGWSRPLQSACADSFPKGEAEKAGTIPRRAGIKIDEVYTHIRLRIRGNRFRKAIL